jgi:hypothetical protein
MDVLAATPAMAEAAMNLRREIPFDLSMADLLHDLHFLGYEQFS